VIQLGDQVVFTGFRADLDLLYLESALLFFGFLLFLGLLVFITAIIHYFADGRLRIGRNLHKIQTVVAGNSKRFVRRNDTHLFPVRINNSDFFGPDILVDIGSVRTVRPVCSFWKNYTFTSLSGLTGNGAWFIKEWFQSGLYGSKKSIQRFFRLVDYKITLGNARKKCNKNNFFNIG